MKTIKLDEFEFEIEENKIKVAEKDYPFALRRDDQLDNWYLYDKSKVGKVHCVKEIGGNDLEPLDICKALIRWGIDDYGYKPNDTDIEH